MRPLLTTLAAALLFGGCSEFVENPEEPKTTETKNNAVNVNLQYSMSESDWGADARKTPLTRATLEDSKVTRITFSVFDSKGSAVQVFGSGDTKSNTLSQTVSDEDFGTIPNFRLSPGTYYFVAVAYKASSDESTSVATITSTAEASINEEALYETYSCVKKVTINSGNYAKNTVPMTLKLCVSRLVLTIPAQKGDIPSEVKKFKVAVAPSTTATASSTLTFDPSTGLAKTDCLFEREWNYTTGGTNPKFTITSCFSTQEKNVSITVSALDADNKTLYTRTLENITMTRAKILKITTYLFSKSSNVSLDFEDWQTVNGGTIN